MSAKPARTATTTAVPRRLSSTFPALERTTSSTGMSRVAKREKAASLTTAKE